jgi:hypothetical protein
VVRWRRRSRAVRTWSVRGDNQRWLCATVDRGVNRLDEEIEYRPPCTLRLSHTVSIRSTKSDPSRLADPKEFFRQSTAFCRARSATSFRATGHDIWHGIVEYSSADPRRFLVPRRPSGPRSAGSEETLQSGRDPGDRRLAAAFSTQHRCLRPRPIRLPLDLPPRTLTPHRAARWVSRPGCRAAS